MENKKEKAAASERGNGWRVNILIVALRIKWKGTFTGE